MNPTNVNYKGEISSQNFLSKLAAVILTILGFVSISKISKCIPCMCFTCWHDIVFKKRVLYN